MFDVGWSELLVIAAIGVMVIGPKELPVVMRTLGRLTRRLQYVRYAFSQQFEDFMQQQDIHDIRNSVNFEAKRQPRDFNEAEADEDTIIELQAEPPVKDEGQTGSGGAA